MNSVPFCHRNVKAWIGLLAVVAGVVMALSVRTAILRPDVFGVARMRRLWHGGSREGGGMGHQGRPIPVAAGVNPVQPVALTAPAVAAPSPPNTGIVDMVARPTPGGSIKFLGGPFTAVPGAQTAFNQAASRIRPCVVSISASRAGAFRAPPPPPSGAQFLDPYDGVPDNFVGQRAFEAVGSGVIVHPNGYVVTNHHVVAGSSGVLVSLASRPEAHLPARVEVSDPTNDLALLSIAGATGTYPSASLGDSSRVQVGDWVLAVGYPFGLELTVTSGIVGARSMHLEIGGQLLRGLLQTDAPINKGSSGGPLVNLSGEVIGINTAIYAPTGVFSGAGFAIPSNRVGAFVARWFEAMGIAQGTSFSPMMATAAAPAASSTVSAAWLGLGLVDVTPDLATQLSFPLAGGVYVASVVLDSPADEAELVRGDIIVSFAGQPAMDVETLRRIMTNLKPGQSVPVTVWRGGKTNTVNLRLRGA